MAVTLTGVHRLGDSFRAHGLGPSRDTWAGEGGLAWTMSLEGQAQTYLHQTTVPAPCMAWLLSKAAFIPPHSPFLLLGYLLFQHGLRPLPAHYVRLAWPAVLQTSHPSCAPQWARVLIHEVS